MAAPKRSDTFSLVQTRPLPDPPPRSHRVLMLYNIAGTSLQRLSGQSATQEEALMQRIAIAAAALWLLPVSLCAQWLDFRTPGIPRTAEGKPNLTAPAPRTPDGKPDFSGLWQPEVNAYRFDVIQDLKDEGIFRPAAEAIFMERVADFRRDDPVTNCLPGGPSEMLNTTYRIIQSPTLVAGLLWSGARAYPPIFIGGGINSKNHDTASV